MSGLTENPHLASLLATKGLEVMPNFMMGLSQSGQPLSVGQVTPQGTVVGFCMPEDATDITAVIYDESKEGEEDAMTTVSCRL